MANAYKVPQDVEAEDKLLGPFSFRQFIYLGVVAMSIAAGWGLFLLFPLLAILPVPIVIFFGALALPLRKDQPMETYLAALWQFYIKPRHRMWMADGVVSRITIDMPVVMERRLTKNITADQAISQFDYLSQVADTGGWSTRGVSQAPQAVVDNPEDDILDSTSTIAQNFDSRLQREDDERREELLARIHSGTLAPSEALAPAAAPPIQPVVQPPVQEQSFVYQAPEAAQMPTYGTDTLSEPAPVYNPSPQYMQQHVIQPFDPGHQASVPEPIVHTEPIQTELIQQKDQEPAESTVTRERMSDIMELAKDVSVETVAKQLHHEEVERHGDEVVINLH